jgi:epsilon-lactone hydrolase
VASEQYQRLAERLWAAKGAYREVPVERLREGMEAMSFPVADDVEVEPVVVAGHPAEWVRAPGGDPDRAVLYLHGGGYVMGSLATHRKLAGDVSRAAGVPVLVLDYPLAPEHPYPAAVDVAAAAFAELAAERGAANLVVAGDSAGGGLTLACVLALRDRGHDLPAAAVALSPWVDLADCDHTASPLALIDPIIHAEGLARMAGLYAGGADRTDPLLSPARADLTGLPPLLIQVGEAEVLLPESQRLAEAAEAAGVDVALDVWPEMPHVWQVFAGRVPEATEAVEGIGRFIGQRLGATSGR